MRIQYASVTASSTRPMWREQDMEVTTGLPLHGATLINPSPLPQASAAAAAMAAAGNPAAGVRPTTGVSMPSEACVRAATCLLRLARDLVAKRAVERYIKKKARGPKPVEVAPDFERLPCCTENIQLQELLGRAEHQISSSSLELKGVVRARRDEVVQLNAEVSQLHSRYQSKNMQNGGGTVLHDFSSQLDVTAARAQEQVDMWQQRLVTQSSEMEVLRRRIFQLQRETAEDISAIELCRKKHALEMEELQLRMHPAASVSRWVAQTGEASRRQADAAELGANLQAARAEREEVQRLLLAARSLHQQEIKLLSNELEAARRDQSFDAEDDEALFGHLSDEAEQKLSRQVFSMYEHAGKLVSFFGLRDLPERPPADCESTAHAQWLRAFGARMTEMTQRIQSAKAGGAN